MFQVHMAGQLQANNLLLDDFLQQHIELGNVTNSRLLMSSHFMAQATTACGRLAAGSRPIA